MSLITKVRPVGVDVPVQAFQTFLYKKLKALWPVSDTDFDGYGRIYKNTNDKGSVPEFIIASPNPNEIQYSPVFYDKSRLKALYFFDIADRQQFDSAQGLETNKVSLIFMTNISLLKPNIKHRGDEEVSSDVQKLCSLNYQNFIMTGNETGFANVFKSFTGLVNKDGEVFEDRHPFFCFKFNLDLVFNPNLTTCN